MGGEPLKSSLFIEIGQITHPSITLNLVTASNYAAETNSKECKREEKSTSPFPKKKCRAASHLMSMQSKEESFLIYERCNM